MDCDNLMLRFGKNKNIPEFYESGTKNTNGFGNLCTENARQSHDPFFSVFIL